MKTGTFRGLVVTDLEVSNSRRYCEILRAQLAGSASTTVSKSALRETLAHAERRLRELEGALQAGS